MSAIKVFIYFLLQKYINNISIVIIITKAVKYNLICWNLQWLCCDVTQQEVCGVMEEFLLANVT